MLRCPRSAKSWLHLQGIVRPGLRRQRDIADMRAADRIVAEHRLERGVAEAMPGRLGGGLRGARRRARELLPFAPAAHFGGRADAACLAFMPRSLTDLFKAKWTADIHRKLIEALLRNEAHRERVALERTRALMDRASPGARRA